MPPEEVVRFPQPIVNRPATIEETQFLMSIAISGDIDWYTFERNSQANWGGQQRLSNLRYSLKAVAPQHAPPLPVESPVTAPVERQAVEDKSLVKLATRELDDRLKKAEQELTAMKEEKNIREEIKKREEEIKKEAEEVVGQKQSTLLEMERLKQVHTSLQSKELALSREKWDLRKLCEEKVKAEKRQRDAGEDGEDVEMKKQKL